MKTVALVPVYNEEEHLVSVLEELQNRVDRIIVIDDGSTDSTRAKLGAWIKGKEQASAFCFDRNRGKGQALLFGFWEVERLRTRGELGEEDVVLTVDADGQHVLQDIPGLVDRLVREGFDVVLAQRDLRLYPFFKRIGNRILSAFATLISGYRYRDCESGLRCLRLAVIPELLKYYQGFRYSDSQEIAVITARKGFRIDNSYACGIRYYKAKGTTAADALYIVALGLLAAVRVLTGWERRPAATRPSCERLET